MTIVIARQASTVLVTVQADGSPLVVSGTVKASVFSLDGRTEHVPEKVLLNTTTGAVWTKGVVAVPLSAIETDGMPVGDSLLVLTGGFGVRRFRLSVESMFPTTRTSLFIRDLVIDEMRTDRLLAAAAGVLQNVKVSDQYIWDKVRAAESEIAHTLRVPLVPTAFFPLPPSEAEIDALEGMAWAVDPGYDYDPTLYQRDKWGYIITRHRPIISIDVVRFSYPSQNSGFFDIPTDWLRFDARTGHIQIVPTSNAVLASMSGFGMTALAGGLIIPAMVQVFYKAGLVDAATVYPELLDAIKKKAVVKIISDAFMPQSGSISADGLSQSMSVDVSKYGDLVDEIIHGPSNSNGGLMTKIHGIRLSVI